MNRSFNPALSRGSGFTLIELVVVLSILSIVGIGLFTTHIRSVEVYAATVEEEKLSSQSWTTLSRIAGELRHASALAAPAPGTEGGSVVFSRPIGSFDSCVSCQDRSLTATYRYDSKTSSLIRETSAGAHIIADNVKSFVANSTSAGPGNILVTITFERTVVLPGGSSRTYTMTTTVNLYGAQNKTWKEVLP